MLIGQGANDPRVPLTEAEQLIAALHANDVPHQYVLFPDEGHGLVKPGNRLHFYTLVEQFLAEHLGGRAEPADANAPALSVLAVTDEPVDTATPAPH
jgi:dienelactone hydrolase